VVGVRLSRSSPVENVKVNRKTDRAYQIHPSA